MIPLSGLSCYRHSRPRNRACYVRVLRFLHYRITLLHRIHLLPCNPITLQPLIHFTPINAIDVIVKPRKRLTHVYGITV